MIVQDDINQAIAGLQEGSDIQPPLAEFLRVQAQLMLEMRDLLVQLVRIQGLVHLSSG